MNPYSQAAEAVDQHLSQSIGELRKSMELGFDRVERRLDHMATKDSLSSEVARIDQQHRHLEEKISTNYDILESRMTSGFAEISSRDDKRDAAAKERDDERDKKFARRMTWTLTCVSIAFAVFQYVSNTYF